MIGAERLTELASRNGVGERISGGWVGGVTPVSVKNVGYIYIYIYIYILCIHTCVIRNVFVVYNNTDI